MAKVEARIHRRIFGIIEKLENYSDNFIIFHKNKLYNFNAR
jgi:hypothetical protein